VFAGGWRLEAAEQVCAGEGVEDWEILDLLTALADKSLVITERRGGDTVSLAGDGAAVCRDRLAEAEERDGVRGRHRDYFLKMTEEIAPKLSGPEQGHWLWVLEEEYDNLRTALTFCLEDAEGGRGGYAWWGVATFWGHVDICERVENS